MKSRVIDREKSLTKFYLPKRASEYPLKRSMCGHEIEVFILKNDGSMDCADSLLKKAKKQGIKVQVEWMKSCVELICMPHKRIRSTALYLVEDMIRLRELAQKSDNLIFPFATYFGMNNPEYRNKYAYSVHKTLVGEKYKLGGLFCGYHQHYTIPRGTFDHKKKMLKHSTISKVQRTFLDSYNMLIALDPIFTTFLQSSPFAQNKYLAKDSRMLLQRGGHTLKYMGGEFAKLQMYGGLPPYKQTISDLISSIKRRYKKRNAILNKKGFDTSNLNEKTLLDFAWNPVKVNKLGTLEYRGGDMNFFSIIMSISTMMNFALRKITQDFTLVVPIDIKLKDSFKQEGKLLFIPPQSVVRKKLQYISAYKGLEDDSLYEYALAFFKFIKRNVRKDYQHLLKPVKKMLDDRKTQSDYIIKKAKKMGYTDEIPDDAAKELAVHFSGKLENDLEKTKKALQRIQ